MITLLGSAPAFACGGFFCAQEAPVVQAAEQIVFVMDDDETGTVEMHVEVTYDGPSENFAWIVPVPAAPEILVGTSSLFDRLQEATTPVWTGTQVDEGFCRESSGISWFGSEYAFGHSLPSPPGMDSPAVHTVGPYETVTLQAPTTDVLVEWLEGFGYDAVDAAPTLLEPYVQSGATFVALRLAKGNDIGDLVPLVLRYAATKAVIPVSLTALAAADGMPLEVYVLSDGRAVPESYLHVQLNMAAIDWPGQGGNIRTIVEEAADEAGGHAFVTDFHGGSSPLAGTLFDKERFSEDVLRAETDWVEWVNEIKTMLPVPPSAELLALLADFAEVAESEADAVWDCPRCYDGFPVDIQAFTNALMAGVIEPLANAQSAIDSHPRLTRLTSSLDASEMTVDPVFVVNHDLDGEEIAPQHDVTLAFECGNGRVRSRADRRLDLPDGRSLLLPSESWVSAHERTDAELLAPHGQPRGQVVEQMSDSGPGVILFDATADLAALADEHNAWVRSLGCGCSSGAAGGLAPFAAGAFLLLLRRRAAV